MESGTEDLHPHSPSMEHPTDQPPVQQDSIEERGSDAEEKLSEEEDKIFSSQLQQNSMEERGSDVEEKLSEEKGKTFSSQSVMGDVPQPYGGFEYSGNDIARISYYCSRSEPETDEEENSKESETQDRNSCTALSDSERGSSPEISWKRKLNSRVGTCETTGASPDECSATPEKKKQKVLDSGHSRESAEIRDARPRRSQRRRPGRSKRPRSRYPGDQPPPLRESLLTSLRSMSEAIYQNIVNVHNQKGYSPLLWEHLAQLRGPLCTAVLATYAMATQAAYVFPAEGWLVPTPLPAPWSPAGDGGEDKLEVKRYEMFFAHVCNCLGSQKFRDHAHNAKPRPQGPSARAALGGFASSTARCFHVNRSQLSASNTSGPRISNPARSLAPKDTRHVQRIQNRNAEPVRKEEEQTRIFQGRVRGCGQTRLPQGGYTRDTASTRWSVRDAPLDGPDLAPGPAPDPPPCARAVPCRPGSESRGAARALRRLKSRFFWKVLCGLRAPLHHTRVSGVSRDEKNEKGLLSCWFLVKKKNIVEKEQQVLIQRLQQSEAKQSGGGGIEREGKKMMHRKERRKHRNGQRRREKQKDTKTYTEKKAHSGGENGVPKPRKNAKLVSSELKSAAK
eukprot:bmy_22275T0